MAVKSPRTQVGIDLDDLTWLHFNGRVGLLTMLTFAALDESSDQTQQQAFVVGGFLATKQYWKSISKEWQNVLSGHSLKYFKSSECRSGTEQFHYLRRKHPDPGEAQNAAKKIRDEFEQVILNSKLVGVGYGIDMQHFREVCALPEARKNINWSDDYFDLGYQLAFGRTAERLHEGGKPKISVAFICDESPHSKKVAESYRQFKKKNPSLAAHMKGMSHLDDKTFLPLQMADLMADVAREMVTEQIKNPARIITTRMKGSVFHVDCLERDGMLQMLRHGSALVTER